MTEKRMEFQLQGITAHYVEEQKRVYWCQRQHWPIASSMGIEEDFLQRVTAAKLETYQQKIGIFGLSGEEKQKKFEESALKEVPVTNNDVHLVEIVSHFEDKFTTRWSNGEVVAERPMSVFQGEDRELLDKYIEEQKKEKPKETDEDDDEYIDVVTVVGDVDMTMHKNEVFKAALTPGQPAEKKKTGGDSTMDVDNADNTMNKDEIVKKAAPRPLLFAPRSILLAPKKSVKKNNDVEDVDKMNKHEALKKASPRISCRTYTSLQSSKTIAPSQDLLAEKKITGGDSTMDVNDKYENTMNKEDKEAVLAPVQYGPKMSVKTNTVDDVDMLNKDEAAPTLDPSEKKITGGDSTMDVDETMDKDNEAVLAPLQYGPKMITDNTVNIDKGAAKRKNKDNLFKKAASYETIIAPKKRSAIMKIDEDADIKKARFDEVVKKVSPLPTQIAMMETMDSAPAMDIYDNSDTLMNKDDVVKEVPASDQLAKKKITSNDDFTMDVDENAYRMKNKDKETALAPIQHGPNKTTDNSMYNAGKMKNKDKVVEKTTPYDRPIAPKKNDDDDEYIDVVTVNKDVDIKMNKDEGFKKPAFIPDKFAKKKITGGASVIFIDVNANKKKDKDKAAKEAALAPIQHDPMKTTDNDKTAGKMKSNNKLARKTTPYERPIAPMKSAMKKNKEDIDMTNKDEDHKKAAPSSDKFAEKRSSAININKDVDMLKSKNEVFNTAAPIADQLVEQKNDVESDDDEYIDVVTVKGDVYMKMNKDDVFMKPALTPGQPADKKSSVVNNDIIKNKARVNDVAQKASAAPTEPTPEEGNRRRSVRCVPMKKLFTPNNSPPRAKVIFKTPALKAPSPKAPTRKDIPATFGGKRQRDVSLAAPPAKKAAPVVAPSIKKAASVVAPSIKKAVSVAAPGGQKKKATVVATRVPQHIGFYSCVASERLLAIAEWPNGEVSTHDVDQLYDSYPQETYEALKRAVLKYAPKKTLAEAQEELDKENSE